MEKEPLIELRGVSKAFGGYPILDEIDLTIYRGEALVIIGPSGTGKSTILRLVAGLLPVDAGEVYIKGKRRKGIIEDGHQPMRIALVFQQAALFDSLTVDENVGFFLYEHSKLPRNRIRELVEAKLAMVGLQGMSDRYPSQLSGGMRKRVSFARALIANPDNPLDDREIVLYDEPTAGLDVTSARTVRELVQQLGEEGGTVIYSTHQLAEAQRVCNRIVIIHNGEVRADGTPEALLDLTETSNLEEAYVSLTGDAARAREEDSKPLSRWSSWWRGLFTPNVPGGGEDE